jgi:hypothetical protein
LQTHFTIIVDGEGEVVLDTGATNFILTVPVLTVPDRFSCRIEGGYKIMSKTSEKALRTTILKVEKFSHTSQKSCSGRWWEW